MDGMRVRENIPQHKASQMRSRQSLKSMQYCALRLALLIPGPSLAMLTYK